MLHSYKARGLKPPKAEARSKLAVPSAFGFRHLDFPRHSSFLIRHSLAGHTLIEMIGVVAVLVILALALTPVVIRRMDRAAWSKEVTDMAAISNALVLQALRNYSIPSETGWAAAAAKWTERPVSQISTNNRRFARLFLYESGGWLASKVPYTQTTNGTGTNVPLKIRIVLVSTIAKALPYTNGAIDSANFNSVWNATNYTKPSFFSSWKGKGDDLVIQRINLDSMFHRLILINRDGTNSPAAFSINSTNVLSATNSVLGWSSFPPNSQSIWSSYYLDGTVVGLCANTVPGYRFVLNGDLSYVFDANLWRAQLAGGGTDNSAVAQTFANQAGTFLATANYSGSHQGADTQGVLSAFYTFMYAYSIWANKCPHFQYTGNSAQAVEFKILDVMGQQGNSGIIYTATGTGGLLK